MKAKLTISGAQGLRLVIGLPESYFNCHTVQDLVVGFNNIVKFEDGGPSAVTVKLTPGFEFRILGDKPTQATPQPLSQPSPLTMIATSLETIKIIADNILFSNQELRSKCESIQYHVGRIREILSRDEEKCSNDPAIS